MFLNKENFAKLVSISPLISIDICILKDKHLLLGKRKNHPAKDFYFVPGGRIRKNEKINDAFNRLLISEMGFKFKKKNIKEKKLLGVYEHFYLENFQGNDDFNTHYIVLAFLISFENIEKVLKIDSSKDQHVDYIWYELVKENNNDIKIHKYTLDYFEELLK